MNLLQPRQKQKKKEKDIMKLLPPKYVLTLCVVSAAFVSPFKEEEIQHVNCSNGIERLFLKNTTAIYFCTDNKHMIFHSSRLDILGTSLPLIVENEKSQKKRWVEVETNDFTVESDGGIPFTNCLSLEKGGNGTLSASFSDNLGVATSLDLDLALFNAGFASLNWAFSGNTGGTLTASTEYACSGQAGQTIQITVVPSYYRFSEAKFRYIYLGEGKTRNVIYEDWQNIPDTKLLASSPMLRCTNDPELLRCDSGIASSWFRR